MAPTRKTPTGGSSKSTPAPQAKKTRKPRKMMSAKKVDPERSRIYIKNQQDSPLLKLPPEVRNMIWGFVLGGNTIHICVGQNSASRKWGRIYHTVCLNDTSDTEYAKEVKTRPSVSCEPSMERHEACKPLSHGFSDEHKEYLTNCLVLLEACRQVHEEAALLPFSSNAFSLWGFQQLELFCNSMLCPQAAAIKNVTLHCHYDSFIRLGGPGSPEYGDVICKKIKALDSMNMLIHVGGTDIPIFVQSGEMDAKLWFDLEWITWFGRVSKPIKSATVAITFEAGSSWVRSPTSPHGLVAEEVREIERSIEDNFVAKKV
ncbi:hypothetical protein MBLNU230_g6155t1 [Neophaeotheca triangularis]